MFSKLKKKASTDTAVAAPAPISPTAAPASQSLASPATTTASNSNSASAGASVGTGILLVRIVEAKLNAKLNDSLPYAVIEFDKNEFVADATGGDAVNPKWTQRANFDVSRSAEVAISLYSRVVINSTTAAMAPAKQSVTNSSALNRKPPTRTPAPQATHDTVSIGSAHIAPQFQDQKPEDASYPIFAPNSTQQIGEIHVQVLFRKITKKAMSIEDFDLLKVIGKGSFGKVMQVRKKDSGRIYAMKIIRKANIVERAEVEHTLAERNVLAKLQNPFIVNLKYSFQSPDKLYLVLAFVNGGELFHHLQTDGYFSDDRARFYAAELLMSLECLHKFNIIYRDLKPENILLDYTGHLALCDFGLCKLNMTKDETTNTFCGTPEYLAPELLIGNGYTKVVDWWTLGVLLYEMLVGLPPFYSENTNEMYRKILSDPLRFPADDGSEGPVVSPQAKTLLTALLERDPLKRLGADGPEEIKRHPFFAAVDWDRLNRKLYSPPFRPNVTSAVDTSNFSDEFTSETPTDSYTEAPALSKSVQEQFQGFTYVGNEGNAMYGASIRTGSTFAQRSALG